MPIRSQHESTRSHSESTRSHNGQHASQIDNPDGFQPEKVRNISSVLNALLADVFALYLKTKNFHWHMSGPHSRDYHLLLDGRGRADLRHDRRCGRAGAQKSAVRLSTPSAGSPACHVPTTTTGYVRLPTKMFARTTRDRILSLVESLRAAHEMTDQAGDLRHHQPD